jgi:adenylate cyclase
MAQLSTYDDIAALGRLLLEDVCSDLVRYLHSGGDPARFESVRVDREYALGPPGAFADLRVEPTDAPPYFLEVKYGYDGETMLAHLHRKYGTLPADSPLGCKLVLVVERDAYSAWPALEGDLRALLPPHLPVEVWDEARLRTLIEECFGQSIPSFAPAELLSIRERIDEGKEALAFGDAAPSGLAERVLRQNLLWHFGVWRIAEMRQARGMSEAALLVPPGGYEHVVVLMADLSGFSRYVRDTPDEAVVRQSLTNFYAKARYQVINAGGMLSQFVGDEVVAVFGIPDRRPGYVEAALRTAFRLLDIGASVSHDWQRKIDHVQSTSSVHIGMAMGRTQLVTMRALDHARLAMIGDCLNIAGRLVARADQGQIMVSNVLRHAVQATPYEFVPQEPFEARSIGTIRAWQLLRHTSTTDGETPPPALDGDRFKS